MTAVRSKAEKALHKKKERLFDTSVCHARFRKPRILQKRERSFDEDRDLGFDPERDIEARLEGIKFRDTYAVGFRTTGLGNLDEVMNRGDWPEMPPSSRPKVTKRKKGPGYEKTWGHDLTFDQKWKVEGSKEETGTPAPLAKGYTQYGTQTRGPDRLVSKKDKKDAYTYNEYALALMSDGEFKRALSYFEKARSLDPGEEIYRINLERCQEWLRSGKGGI